MSYSDINFATKKVLGYANTSLDSNITYDPKNISSFQKISINQIYAQSIPATVDYIVKRNSDFGKSSLSGLTFKGYIDSLGVLFQDDRAPPSGAYGCLYTVDKFSHIQYVQSLPIMNRVNKSSGSGSRTIFNINIDSTQNSLSTNYFTNIIPFSYGSGYGYSLTQGYKLYQDSLGKNVMNKDDQCAPYRNSTNNIVDPNDYVIDPDAGLLYIKTDDWNLNTSISNYNGSNGFPTLSFFRYAGKMGVETPASSNASTPDVWSNVNIVGAPSAVSGTGTFTTTDAYYDFIYPTQIDSGIGLLPRIDTFYVNIGDTGTTLITIPNTKATYSVTGSNYLSVTGSVGPTGSLFITTDQIVNGTGPILINGTGSGLLESSGNPPDIIQSINFSKTKKTGTVGTSPLGLKYYSINYPNLTPGDYVNFYLWYGNGNRNPNVASYYFTYLKARNPSPPQLSTITAPSYNSLLFGWTGSSQIDSNDPLSSANLIYTISYGPTGINNRRYGGIAGTGTIVYSTGTTGMTGGFNNVQIQSTNNFPVFPDTNYFVKISASNSTLGTGTGSFLQKQTLIGTTGPPLPYTQNAGSTGITGASLLISANPVLGTTTINNLLKTSKNGQQFNVQKVNIHNSIASRGNTEVGLVSFDVDFQRQNETTRGPTGYLLNGFGYTGSSYTQKVSNGLSISAGSPSDQYISTEQGCNGYYLQNSISVGTTGSILKSSPYEYTLSATGMYTGMNSGISSNYYTKFYYDGEATGPSIPSMPLLSIIFDDNSFRPICGIYVTQSIKFNVGVTGVTGIGQYFYNAESNGIISYTPTGNTGLGLSFTPSKETNLTNLTSGTEPNGFKLPISFNNSLILNGANNVPYYIGPIGVSITPYNVGNTGGVPISSTGINFIFDKNSLTNILNSPLSVTVTSTPSSGSNGCRVYSGLFPGTYENTPSNDLKYLAANLTFDNTKNLKIEYDNELLYANGKFCTPGLSPECYRDYSYYKIGNFIQPDYTIDSNDPIYRYATFIWSVPQSVFMNTASYRTLNFSILNTTGIIVQNGLAYGKTYIDLYYSVIDSSSPKLPDIQEKCITTYWIDANASNGGTLITANNCYIKNLPSVNYTGSSIPNITPSGNNLNFSVTSGGYSMSSVNIPLGGTTNPVYVYLRIGLPINSPISFTGVTCNLST